MTTSTDTITGTGRDRAATALVLAAAAALWCTWGLAEPPVSWRLPIEVAAYLAVAVAVLAGVLTWRRRHQPTAMADPAVRRSYLRVVGVESAAICVGAVVAGASGHPALIPAWILLVVGVHFVPLGRSLAVPELVTAGVLCAAVAVVAAVAGVVGEVASGAVAPSAVAGGVGGLVMLVTAAACLVRPGPPAGQG